jgi:lipoprotein-anchoring transpeptidase ErfK/SrfK
VGDAVVVFFRLPISEEDAKKSFSIHPALKGELVWLEAYRELRFVPLLGFDPDTSYTVEVRRQGWFFAQVGGGNKRRAFQPKGLAVKFNARIVDEESIYYITESGLKRARSMEVFLSYPGNREEDIRAIDKETLSLYPDNTLVHLENDPEVYKVEGGKIHLIQNPEVFDALGLDWGAIAPVSLVEFNSYSKGDPISIPAPATPHQKAVEGKLIDVDLEEMRFTLWDNGKVIAEFPVSGKGNPARSPTRKGLFSVLTKEPNHLSSLSRVWMPWSMRYSGDFFIHEWPHWPSGALVSSQYSAGCVRLNQGDAKKVYDFADIGTPVLVH